MLYLLHMKVNLVKKLFLMCFQLLFVKITVKNFVKTAYPSLNYLRKIVLRIFLQNFCEYKNFL